jgi:hypothetical protein
MEENETMTHLMGPGHKKITDMVDRSVRHFEAKKLNEAAANAEKAYSL